MTILIIDDDVELRRIVALSLGPMGGMTVVEADSASSGLALAESRAPDAILLDVQMPDMDGPTLLDALRRNPATARIPVVFLTASAEPDERAALLAHGARGVLAKPFNIRSLAADVRALLTAG